MFRKKPKPFEEYPPTPQVFWDWERRLDPFLRKEDRNPAFEVFHRRRRVHSTPRGRWLEVVLSVFVFVFCLTVVIFTNICFLLLLLAVLTPFYYAFIERTAFFGTGRRGLKSVFNKKFWHNELLHDLWMSGVSGGDILEGIMLERRKGAFWAVLISFLFLGGLLCLGASLLPLSWMRFLVMAAALYALFELLLTIAYSSRSTERGICREYIPHFEGLSEGSGLLTRETKKLFYNWKEALLFLGVIIGAMIAIPVGVRAYQGTTKFWAGIPWYGYGILLTLSFLGLGLFFNWRRRRSWKRRYRKLRVMIVGFDRIFDGFVRIKLLDDPDALRRQ